MNLCFLMGKIISNIEFNFMLESHHISIATFEVLLNNKSVIHVKAYDEIADKCYKELVKSDEVAIQGYLNRNMELIVEEI